MIRSSLDLCFVERFQDSKKNVPLQVVRLRDVQQTFPEPYILIKGFGLFVSKKDQKALESRKRKRKGLYCAAPPLNFFHHSIIN